LKTGELNRTDFWAFFQHNKRFDKKSTWPSL